MLENEGLSELEVELNMKTGSNELIAKIRYRAFRTKTQIEEETKETSENIQVCLELLWEKSTICS